MKKFLICLAVLCFQNTAAGETYKTSFDCGGQLVAAEKIVCEDEFIAKQDLELSRTYKTVLEKYNNYAEKVESIKQAQRAWVREMRKLTGRDEIAGAYLSRIRAIDADTDGYYILMEESFDYRPGAAHVDSGSSFNAVVYSEYNMDK
jgi:uncharacterized protein